MDKKPKRPRDLNQLAKRVVEIATGQAADPAPHATAEPAGRSGGLRGGRARAKTLSPERRREIAHAAALARWSKPGGIDNQDEES